MRRLKPILEQLRGPEAKGVDIVNFMLHENPEHVWRAEAWGKRLNTFEYGEAHDLDPLLKGVPIENIRKLMPWAASRAAEAPWPQVRAIADALAEPLSKSDEESLKPYLRWPRSAFGR